MNSNIRYIDLEEGELMHWKYIRKEKLPNGKTRYYYDESELDKSLENANLARTWALQAGARAAEVQVRGKHNFDRQGSSGLSLNAVSNVKARAMNYTKKIEQTKKSANYYWDLADRAMKEYKTKRITSFPERVISKGIVFLANLFN
jgi:hypothetical protein